MNLIYEGMVCCKTCGGKGWIPTSKMPEFEYAWFYYNPNTGSGIPEETCPSCVGTGQDCGTMEDGGYGERNPVLDDCPVVGLYQSGSVLGNS